MSLKILPKEAIPEWIELLVKEYRLVGPKSLKDQYVFADMHSANELDLGYRTSILPPKKALLPQYEDLLTFDTQETAQTHQDDQPTVILGMHTCDLHAITLLDRVFTQRFTDQHYMTKRENTTIVSIECLKPCTEHSFCKDMGTWTVPEEFDLHLTDIGEVYAVDIGSLKGEALLKGFNQMRESTPEDRKLASRVLSNKWPHFTYKLETDVTNLPNLLAANYKSPVWEEVGAKCLACGMCTLVCPTCYCFNIQDEVEFTLTSGRRFRVWDSCQLDQFATVAGGHDFRNNRASRQRHRFLRKYRYQAIEPGLVGCVGCGRCGQTCIADITPVGVLNELVQHKAPALQTKREVVVK